MQKIKFFLLLFLLAFLAALLYISLQPNSFEVKRSKTIAVSAEKVYNNLIDLKNWEAWSPWKQNDTTMVITLGEKTKGVGGWYTWVDSHGKGSLKTVATNPNASIDYELQFGDFTPSNMHFFIEEPSKKETKLTWTMSSNDVPFVFKLSALFTGGFDKMIGPDFELGLDKLNQILIAEKEVETTNFKLSTIEETKLPATYFIGYPVTSRTDISLEEISKLFMKFMPKAGAYVAQQLKPNEYIPGTVYTKWDEKTKEAQYYIGILCTKTIAPATDMVTVNLPNTKCIKISKFGDYGTGDAEANQAINTYMNDKNLQQSNFISVELYVNDPETVHKNEIQTDTYYPLN